jgi:MerR family redox-sensitive transcriptional activator SoxR
VISRQIKAALQTRIEMLEKTRDLLDGCIGCGCLSLDKCALYNRGDRAARGGAGPRFLLGDRPQDFDEADGSTNGPQPVSPPRRQRSRP